MEDSAYTLFRVAGAIVLTPDNLDTVDRQDILDSLLLAQLYANKHHDPFEAADEWARACVTCLDRTHWTVTSSKSTVTTLITPFSAISAITSALQPQEGDFGHALMHLPSATKQDLRRLGTRYIDGKMHAKLAIVKAIEAGEIQFKSLMFACTSETEDDWLEQLHPASALDPVKARLNDFSFSLTADFTQVRNKVAGTLGAQRNKEIQVVDPKE